MRAFERTAYDDLLTELSTVDAAYIETFVDYYIARLRSASPVPVVGAGEASLA